MYRNNINHKIIENQANCEKSVSFADNFAKKPTFYSKYLTPSHLRVMDAFVYYDNKFGNVFPGQQEIADIAGISYNHCNKKIKELVLWGFIEKESRGRFRQSLQYYLNPMFKDKSVRARLSKYFPSLRWVPIVTLMLASLLSNTKELQKEYNVPIRERNIYIYPYPTVTDSYTVKHGATYGGVLNKTFQKEKKNGFSMNAFEKKDILEQIANKNYENVIPNYIRELKDLNLTKWGQIRLSVFPEQAIKLADQSLKAAKVNCKFSVFIKICMDYCRKNDMRPDWKWQNKLFEVLHKPDNAKFFIQRSIPVDEKNKETESTVEKQARMKKEEIIKIEIEPDALQEVKTWEERHKSGQHNRFLFGLNYVYPNVLCIIREKKIPQNEIDRLLIEYPFIEIKLKGAI